MTPGQRVEVACGALDVVVELLTELLEPLTLAEALTLPIELALELDVKLAEFAELVATLVVNVALLVVDCVDLVVVLVATELVLVLITAALRVEFDMYAPLT